MSPATEEVATARTEGLADAAAGRCDVRWWMPLAVTLPALFLRILGFGGASNAIDDAPVHVLTGMFYAKDGLLFPDAWWSPPLKHLVTGLALAAFGNDEVGWRLKDVLLGALAAYLVFLLARRLFRHAMPALVAAALFALDPFSIGLAHTTHEDVPAVCMVLLGTLLFAKGLDEDREWPLAASGLAFGLGIALRWYVGLAMLPVAAWAVWQRRKEFARLASAAAAYTVVPLTAYLATYLPWFGRGYTLADWAGLQADALAIQGPRFQGLPADLAPLEGAWRWFVTWVGSGSAGLEAGRASTVTVLMNDPVLWVLFIPSALLLAWHGMRRGRPQWVVVAASFLATCAFMLFSPRPIVLYSAMAIVPLGFVCLGFAAAQVLRRRTWWFLGIASAWSLYLYPLVSGNLLWRPAYEWILRAMTS